MLELVGVVVEGDGVNRLDRCSFECRAGEVLGLAGATGAGKSTALAVASGLIGPDRGRVLLEGRDVTRKPGKLRAAVALVSDENPGPHDLTVEAWLHLWAELDGVKRAERAARISAQLERFGLTRPAARVDRLSGGESARLALVRAWVRAPRIVLLDAPGALLDGDGLRHLTGAIRASTASGTTVIIAASTPHLLTTVCERVVLMRGGAVRDTIARGTDDFARRVARVAGWAE